MSFENFWTNAYNPRLDPSEYLYSTRHIIILVVVALLCVALTLLFRKKSERTKQILFFCCGGGFLFMELASRVVNLIITDNYGWAKILEIILPMHICSVMVWVFIIAIFTKKQGLLRFAVIGGLIATLVFLLYPAVGINQVYMNFTNWYSVVSHCLGFVTAILLLTLGFVKFELKTIWQPFLGFALMFAWGAIVNFVLLPNNDQNYMFMQTDPLELNLPFHYSLLYIGLLIVYTLCYYLVYAIIKRCKRKDIEIKITKPKSAE